MNAYVYMAINSTYVFKNGAKHEKQCFWSPRNIRHVWRTCVNHESLVRYRSVCVSLQIPGVQEELC